jgi:Tfp pilus assembly protein PilX
MKKEIKKAKKVNSEKRKDERGAAMVMVLLISFLLLIASGSLLLEVSKHTANVTDATAEQQAYNAAESGIQSALNVLRGNTAPNPLINTAESADHIDNRIDFTKAVTLSTSNNTGDSSASARLSRWLNYDSTFNDRIILGTGTASTYDESTGYAYSVEVSDPDNTGTSVSYSTNAKINGSFTGTFYGNYFNGVMITFDGANVSNLDVSSGLASTNFGKFRIRVFGGGATIPDDIRFEIRVNMTSPYTAKRVIRGTIESGTVTSSSVGSVRVDFDSRYYNLMGSDIALASDPLNLNPPSTNSGYTDISGSITPAEPIRLKVTSRGFGPRGARKELEAIVRKNFFDGMIAPATLTMVGSTTGFEFDAGQSQVVTYSGDDVVTDILIPPIGTSNDINLASVEANLAGAGVRTDVIGQPANVEYELPTWLESAQNLDDVIQRLKNVAESSGRYFPSGTTPTNFGDNANATGITYVDGDIAFSAAGGGLMIVTGKLTLWGGFDFNGLIVVTGSGGVDRSGGGDGVLQGNIVIAPYDPDNLIAGFSGPKYDISGGGTSAVTYNSSSLANGLTAVSNFVLGVAEK